ncbi:hypothetical protein ACUM6W_02435 [Acinetobacter tandoii]|uniref:hypothetical protein n=1 Tax=Acinetobacter tandoii TaxID=202954 RepID=UPI0040468059
MIQDIRNVSPTYHEIQNTIEQSKIKFKKQLPLNIVFMSQAGLDFLIDTDNISEEVKILGESDGIYSLHDAEIIVTNQISYNNTYVWGTRHVLDEAINGEEVEIHKELREFLSVYKDYRENHP